MQPISSSAKKHYDYGSPQIVKKNGHLGYHLENGVAHSSMVEITGNKAFYSQILTKMYTNLYPQKNEAENLKEKTYMQRGKILK